MKNSLKPPLRVNFLIYVTLLLGLLNLTGSQYAVGQESLNENNLTVTKSENGYPEKPIKIMVPANPGGGWDQLARLIQHTLEVENISPVPFEVINRGGAGGVIGLTELVGRHVGDGYTVMIGGGVMAGAAIAHGSPFSLTDTTLIARLVSEYEIIAVPYDSPYQNFAELIEGFRTNTDTFTWGGGSAGGIDHILVGLIAELAGVPPEEINYVAYTGGGEAGAAVMGGQVTAGVSGLAEWEGLAEGKRLRILAVSSPERIGKMNYPTIKEEGFDIVLENWRCLVAAPGVDNATVEWLTSALFQMQLSESWQDILTRYSWENRFLTGEDFENFLLLEQTKTKAILSRLGIGKGGEGYAIVGPFAFPILIGIFLFIIGGFLMRDHLRIANKGSLEISEPMHLDTDKNAKPHLPSWKGLFLSSGATLIYILLLLPVGFLIATPPFIVVQAYLIGSRKIIRNSIVAVILSVVVFSIFTFLLHVEVP